VACTARLCVSRERARNSRRQWRHWREHFTND
jgi:hypothetical protein